MRALIPFELLTALLAGYLALSLPRGAGFYVFQGLHFATVVVAGLAIASGAWRRGRWVPKAAVLLAAWAGIPTFQGVAAVVGVIRRNPDPAVGVSFGMVLWATVCQLVALLIALRTLEIRDAAV